MLYIVIPFFLYFQFIYRLSTFVFNFIFVSYITCAFVSVAAEKHTHNPMVQRRYSQHLKQFGAQTMDRILCLRRLTILKSEQWCIHGLIPALLWLCKVLVVHHFQKRERYDIQRLDHEIPTLICGSSMLATLVHYKNGPLSLRSYWTDSKLIASIWFFLNNIEKRNLSIDEKIL